MSESPAVGHVVAVCLQVCRVSPFITKNNSGCDTKRGLTDAKSVKWIR